jgi:hypothetical protein
MSSLTCVKHVMELFPAIPGSLPGRPGKLLPFRMAGWLFESSLLLAQTIPWVKTTKTQK